MMSVNFFKYVLLLFTISSVFYACKSNAGNETRNIQLLSDSTTYRNNIKSDTATGVSPVKKASVTTIHKSTGNHNSTVHTNGNGNTSNNNSASTSNNSNSGSNEKTSTTTTSSQKKGWSKGAQGAVIGGATGAVGGAIISKKKGTGAAIGAVVGAAGGYIIGHEKDKKDGRVNK